MFDLIYRLLVGATKPAPAGRATGLNRQQTKRRRNSGGVRKPVKPKSPWPQIRQPRGAANGIVSSRATGTADPSQGVTVYHGTPSLENAKSIVRHGWIVGTGNALGDGVYTTTSVSVARSYAGANGYLVKARLQPGKSAVWTGSLDRAFRRWVVSRGCSPDMSARTAFLLERGYRTLQQDNVYVVLMRGYRNPAATKVKPKCLRVVEVQDATTGRRVRV